ncbi:MAG: NAD(P)/FAD-dependent oxidoreductase [Rhodanobacter sp.]
MSERKHEAVILGGGLAGLCLALQLRGEFPDMDILVLERNRHPLPAAAHKVGESTVEIGAHYFDHTLGLREHLDSAHIRKFGLRYFFSDGRNDIENTTELGVSQILPVPSYQLDRGIFETFLGEETRRRGIDFRDGATVKSFTLGEHGAAHSVRFVDDAGEHIVEARWLLDASGRAGLLRRRLDLTVDNGHHANAVWFRMNTRLDIGQWSDDTEWAARCSPPERWRSTNHLMGAGYWAWLIPLSSGAHSVGIVCDAAMHPLEGMRDFERALQWLHAKQPALGRAIAAERDSLLDFRFLRNYSHSSKQLFSPDRWALTGEAGTFLDPFYSPGSDFIAICNTYIVELIRHDRAGRNIAPYAHFYEKLYFSFYENTLALFRDQYQLFGNAEVLSAKVIWDYAYYWGVLCQLVFQHRLTDLSLLGEMRPELEAAQALNTRMQQLFRQWHAAGGGQTRREMLDQCALAWFAELNATLYDPLDDTGIRKRLRDNVRMLDGVADALVLQACMSDPRLHAPLSGQPRPPLFRALA